MRLAPVVQRLLTKPLFLRSYVNSARSPRLLNSLENNVGEKVAFGLGVAEFERGDDLQRLLTRAQQALEKDLEGDNE